MKNMTIFFLTGLFLFFSTGFVMAEELKDVIKLPEPQLEGGMPLMQALKMRQSTRGNFGPDEKLSLQQLSNLLWAADGINRPGGYRTAPSAVNWHHMEIYVTTAEGLFLYDAQSHSLKILGKKDVRFVAGQQPFVTEAPVNLIYVADFAKAKGFGGQGEVMPTAEVWSFAETGAIAQNVYLWCASEGLACIVRAMIDEQAVRKTLNLRPDQHVTLAQTIAHFKK